MAINPNSVVVQLDFSGSDHNYIGKGPRGAITSDPVWFIKRLNLTGGTVTSMDSSGQNAIWDNRTTTLYN